MTCIEMTIDEFEDSVFSYQGCASANVYTSPFNDVHKSPETCYHPIATVFMCCISCMHVQGKILHNSLGDRET
jgi:hypothetical protein